MAAEAPSAQIASESRRWRLLALSAIYAVLIAAATLLASSLIQDGHGMLGISSAVSVGIVIGVASGLVVAAWFEDDLALMGDLGWLQRWWLIQHGLPESEKPNSRSGFPRRGSAPRSSVRRTELRNQIPAVTSRGVPPRLSDSAGPTG